jgi:excisionase family DNA binding protein
LDGRDYFVSLTVNERSAADFLAQSLVGPFKGLGSSFTPGESWSYDDGVLRWSFVTERESLDFYAAVCFVAQAETRSAAVPGPLLTLDDVAHRLQLHRDTVRDLVTRGALPVTRVGTGRGRLRVTPEALAEYIAAGEARGTPPKRNRA